MSTPVNCGTSFCSCIECVAPLQTMTRDELNTEIVVAITVFKAAKREELVKAVKDARAVWKDAWGANVSRAALEVAWYPVKNAEFALKAYDKEKNT